MLGMILIVEDNVEDNVKDNGECRQILVIGLSGIGGAMVQAVAIGEEVSRSRAARRRGVRYLRSLSIV